MTVEPRKIVIASLLMGTLALVTLAPRAIRDPHRDGDAGVRRLDGAVLRSTGDAAAARVSADPTAAREGPPAARPMTAGGEERAKGADVSGPPVHPALSPREAHGEAPVVHRDRREAVRAKQASSVMRKDTASRPAAAANGSAEAVSTTRVAQGAAPDRAANESTAVIAQAPAPAPSAPSAPSVPPPFATQAPPDLPPAGQRPKTRDEVRAELARARGDGSLPRFGNPDPYGPGGVPGGPRD
jgi:hypothetical protein